MLTRILFVDDEPKLLDGLKRTLKPMRGEWEAEFTNGGAAALKALEERPFDAIVTDVGMPGMDGATLLREVMGRYPQLLRVTLCGHSEMAALMQSAGVAHQYLPKPCRLEDLRATITRAVSLRRLLNDPQLRTLVSQIGTLPSVPPLYLELMKLIDSPFATLQQIGNVIAKDMALCAKVLQFANSAMFGRGHNVSDPGTAAGHLGFNTVKNLCLAAQVFHGGHGTNVPGFSVDLMWNHSVKVSRLAECIMQTMAGTAGDTRSQAQVSGLLHDIGRLVMVEKMPLKYEAAIALAKKDGVPLHQAERETFGASHAELGAHVLSLWGLPEPVVESIAFHHAPDRIRDFDGKQLMTAVYAAERMTHAWSANASGTKAMEECLSALETVAPGKSAAFWRGLYETSG